MKPERDFNVVLDRCLDALQRGASLEAILEQHPDEAGRLQPILRAAQFVAHTPNPKPSSEAEARSKAGMVAALAEKQAASRQKKKTVLDDLGIALQLKRGKGLIVFIVSLALVFILLSTLSVSAAESLPSSRLYPVKLAFQDLHLLLTFDPEEKQRRYAFYYHIRQQDLLAAIKQQRFPEADAWATMTAMPTPAPTWTPQE